MRLEIARGDTHEILWLALRDRMERAGMPADLPTRDEFRALYRSHAAEDLCYALEKLYARKLTLPTVAAVGTAVLSSYHIGRKHAGGRS